jgi:dTDP-4-dehydrorhamnose reductase
MHVLLTGASGFLGSVCLGSLLETPGVRVTALRSGATDKKLPVAVPEIQLPEKFEPSALEDALSSDMPTHVIHVGALASPELCENSPEMAFNANMRATQALATFAARVGAHMTTTSTDLVFDAALASSTGFTERSLPCPRSIYSQSKMGAEDATLSVAHGTVVRLSLLYGNSPSAPSAFAWMEKAFKAKEKVTLYHDEFRTPIHVRDAAATLILLTQRKIQGLWHCGGPERLSRVQFGLQFAEALGYDASLIESTSRLARLHRPMRPEDVSLNSDKLKSTFGLAGKTVREALTLFREERSNS